MSLAARTDFPTAAAVTYLNQASVGLVPQPVLEHLHESNARISGGGTTDFDDDAEERVVEALRQVAGRFFAAPGAAVAITPTATEVINQFAWWLRPRSGENVVLVDSDFPSVTLPWQRLSCETDVALRFLRTHENPGNLTTEAVADLVDGRTRAICLSHVHFATGHRFDLGVLSQRAREVGAWLVVDASQSAGVLPLAPYRDGVDLLVATSHKWLCAPHGVALAVAGERLGSVFHPPFVGWRGLAGASWHDQTAALKLGAGQLELGSLAYPAAMALGHAITYLTGLGLDKTAKHEANLSARLKEGLLNLGATLVTPMAFEQSAGIVSATFPWAEASDIVRNLAARAVQASCRQNVVRFSVHIYNNYDDLAHLFEELGALEYKSPHRRLHSRR